MNEQNTPIPVRWWFTNSMGASFKRRNTGLDIITIAPGGNIVQQVSRTEYHRNERGDVVFMHRHNTIEENTNTVSLKMHNLVGTEEQMTAEVQRLVRKIVMSRVSQLVVVTGILYVVLTEAAFHQQPMTYMNVAIGYTRDWLSFQSNDTMSSGPCPIDLFGSSYHRVSRYERPLVI